MCQLMDAGKKDIVEVTNQPSLKTRRTNTTCSLPIFDSFWEKAIHNACRRLTSDQFYIDLLPRSSLLSSCNWILHLSFDFFIAWDSLTRAAQNWILFLSYPLTVFYCQGQSNESCTELDTVPVHCPIPSLSFIARDSLTRAAQNWILFLSCLFPVFYCLDSLTNATQYWMLHISYPILCLLLPGTISRELHGIEYCTYILTYPLTVFLAPGQV